ncbi:hypothetical protein [Paenibacillus polymyxa]|uniref:Uncharacterized protein n=1 Tax=Paenibacillus polymyxa (strain SC2) TaxID=886882 RepID=E3EKK7_PAEPS|nr:hypothetical protein [Paenibacillus polymyxa]ADO59839.1 hypothetical protein PPSC2_25975 [Paenibacillus polymyxa SC2]WPQ59929.1 hypothetical protein SKN87_27185 [Paenibacillus polymyxa]
MDKKILDISHSQILLANLKKYCEAAYQRGETITVSSDAILNLLQLIEIKDKALGFYADLKNWEQYYGSLDIDSAILNDYGIIARAALNGEATNS